MARPQETVKKREKEMKRREKREKKLQRRLEKKELAPEDGTDGPLDDYPQAQDEERL